MKAYRKHMLTIAAVALAAIGAYPSPAAAQAAAEGKFTLPYEVKWQDVVLPAGDYTFTLASADRPARLIIRGPRGPMFVVAITTNERNTKGKSALTVERHDGTLFVRDLYVAFLDRTFLFRVPKISKEEEARGPVTSEEVLVALAR